MNPAQKPGGESLVRKLVEVLTCLRAATDLVAFVAGLGALEALLADVRDYLAASAAQPVPTDQRRSVLEGLRQAIEELEAVLCARRTSLQAAWEDLATRAAWLAAYGATQSGTHR